MRRQRGLVGLAGLAALVGLVFMAKPTSAGVTTEQSASILVFPKVIADGTRDTIIQITNTSNNMQHAHCFYVNASLTDPSLPPGPLNPPLWTETDFDVWFTKQQPTHWVVSTGRLDNPFDASCRTTSCNSSTSGTDHADCCDAGFDPGHVPPVAPDFVGELKCVQVDPSGAPLSGNSLKGEATIEEPRSGDVSKYNAIGIMGNNKNNGDGTLCLGTSSAAATADCPKGAEYDACPSAWLLDHPSAGAEDPVAEEYLCNGQTTSDCNSSVNTTLTVVPCTENFETQTTPNVTLQFLVTNEFEQTLSASTTLNCWASYDLGSSTNGISDIFNVGTLGGSIAFTQMRSAAKTPNGVLAVLEETHTANFPFDGGSRTLVARSAQNGHTTFADQAGLDIITIPTDQIQPPLP